MLKTFLFCALSLATPLGFAQPVESFTYKGLALGASIEEFKSKFPAFECSKDKCDYTRRSCVRSGSVATIVADCDDRVDISRPGV